MHLGLPVCPLFLSEPLSVVLGMNTAITVVKKESTPNFLEVPYRCQVYECGLMLPLTWAFPITSFSHCCTKNTVSRHFGQYCNDASLEWLLPPPAATAFTVVSLCVCVTCQIGWQNQEEKWLYSMCFLWSCGDTSKTAETEMLDGHLSLESVKSCFQMFPPLKLT